MQIDVVVPDKTVVLDGVGYVCPTLAPPEDWAHAYHWRGDGPGTIEPRLTSNYEAEEFSDIRRLRFAVDAHAAAKAEAERELVWAEPAPADIDPEPRPAKRRRSS